MLVKKTLQGWPQDHLTGKWVVVRVDFNVPLQEKTVMDDTRLTAAIPTLKYLVQNRCRVVVLSHLGQPKKPDPALSLAPIARRLGELMRQPIQFNEACIGSDVVAQVNGLEEGEILVLENLRFHPEEVLNEPNFAQQLASYGQLFVQEAFGTLHRAHASTAGIPSFLPAVAGFLVEKELAFLEGAIQTPKRPFVAIIGGSKVSSKIGVLDHLLNKVDILIIGGGMAFTFFKAQGYEIGQSLCESNKLADAQAFLKNAATGRTKVILPVDQVVVETFDNDAPATVVPIAAFQPQHIGVDAGPATIQLIQDALKGAQTILWNGPLGVFEMPNFAKGTLAVAHTLAEATDAITIVGGGDSAAAITQAGLSHKMTHISTGGGASLEFLEGRTLPGLAALEDLA